MKNHAIKVNFLQESSKNTTNKAKIYKFLTLLVFLSLIFSMSLMGVFLVPQVAYACHGGITIIKDTGQVSSPSFGFSGTGGAEAPGDFRLAGGEQWQNDWIQGDTIYTFTENDIPSDWEFSHIECSGGDTSINGDSVSIDLNHGDDVVCTFYNEYVSPPTGTITIIKDSVPDDSEIFSFLGDLGSFSLFDDGTQTGDSKTFSDLALGDYTVTEEVVTGWDLSDVSCEGGSYDSTNNGVVITLEADEHTACTFTNEKDDEDSIIVKAYKLVCKDESYLPDWGLAGIQADEPTVITDSTASDYVSNSEGNCWLEADWKFQWGYDGEAEKQLGDHIGPAPDDTGWHNFDSNTQNLGETPAQVVISGIEEVSQLWFRENLKEGYFPFSSPPGDLQSATSAEMYCDVDTLHFDNYEWINNLTNDTTYYCVAMNALLAPEDGTLIVKKIVVGGEATSSDWMMHVDDTIEFAGSVIGTSNVLTPGAYLVTETSDIANYTLTYSGDCDADGSVTVFPNTTSTCVLTNTYHEEPETSISGCKYNDKNNNGEINEGESTLNGWEFNLYSCSYSPLEVGVTQFLPLSQLTNTNGALPDEQISGQCVLLKTVVSSDGCYEFSNLSAGDYGVAEVQRTDWTQTYPVDNTFYYLNLANGEQKTNVDFANYHAPYCGDGNLDEGEQCDDGNNSNGDGCSSTCTTESSGGGGGGGYTSLHILDVKAECVTENSVKISWRTNLSAISWVIYGKDSDAIEDATSTQTSGKNTSHSIIVDGLEPYVDYYYDIKATVGSRNDTERVNYNTNKCVEVKGEEGEPVLEIAKTVDQYFVNPGDKGIKYTVTVKNTGNLTAFNVNLEDILPDELVFADFSDPTRDWNLGDIVPGESKTVEYLVDVKEDVEPDVYVNTAKTWSENHHKVSDTADVESREIVVLAESGFSDYEFLFLIITAFFLYMASYKLRKSC